MARPQYVPQADQREQVRSWAATGMSHERIARGLGVSRGTLAKHFAPELQQSWCRRRFEIVNAVYESAMGGSVQAMIFFLKLGDRSKDIDADRRNSSK